MGKNFPFKEGDKIYHPYWGWGTVERSDYQYFVVNHNGQSHHNTAYSDYCKKLYSFTEYDLIKGGLSHERPVPTKPEPPKEYGVILWVDDFRPCCRQGYRIFDTTLTWINDYKATVHAKYKYFIRDTNEEIPSDSVYFFKAGT